MCAALLPHFFSHISSTNNLNIFCNTYAIARCGQWMCACRMYISFCVQCFYIITEYWKEPSKRPNCCMCWMMAWQPVFGFAWFSLLRNVYFESHENFGWSIDFVCIHTLHVNIPYPFCRFICILHSFSLAVAWVAFLVWILVQQKHKNLTYFFTDARVVRKILFSDFQYIFSSFSLSLYLRSYLFMPFSVSTSVRLVV